ncbi:MAG: transglutaminase domain-containing protein [Muribaculaceae bacterium]|nr:transglutaminase domain-containing protein [Muribaculaceae bacterium]
MKRYNVLPLLIAFAGYLSGYAATPENSDNIVIDDETRTYTIIEKNGEMVSVKYSKETTYTALRTDGYADAVTFYNDNITIDKASAPGAKPYYRSWQSSDVFYDGSRICYLHVPVKKDKKAKVSFQQTYKAPEHFCNINLASPYQINKGTTIIKVPAPLASRIKVEPFCLPDNIVLSRTAMPDGSIEYTATTNDLPAFKPEKGATSASVSAPQLVVTGMFKDVNDLYHHFCKYTEGSDAGSPEIDRLAAEIASKASTPQAIADSTASWVRRNIRYLAIEHGEYAFRPEAAPDVLKNRAGDCKGSANLIKALLKSNGLDGRLVWIGTNGDIPFEWEKVPALCSGNHVIAACMLPDTTLFLDGTTTWAQPGYIPPSIRGRQVIIEDGDNCILAHVPDPGYAEDGEYIMAQYEIDGNDLVGVMGLELHGVKRSQLLAASSDTEPRNRELLYKRILNYPRKSAEADSIVITDNSPSMIYDERPTGLWTVITAKVREKNAAKKIGDKIYLDLQPLRDAMIESVDIAGRMRPYSLPYGYLNGYVYFVKIPDGYKVESLPAPLVISDKWYDATISYDDGKGEVLGCVVKIETKNLDADLSEIPSRNAGVKSLRRASDTQIILSPK